MDVLLQFFFDVYDVFSVILGYRACACLVLLDFFLMYVYDVFSVILGYRACACLSY